MQDYRKSLLLKYVSDLEKCESYNQLNSWSDDYMHEIITNFSLKLHDSLFKSRLRDIYMNTKKIALARALIGKDPEQCLSEAESMSKMLQVDKSAKIVINEIARLYKNSLK